MKPQSTCENKIKRKISFEQKNAKKLSCARTPLYSIFSPSSSTNPTNPSHFQQNTPLFTSTLPPLCLHYENHILCGDCGGKKKLTSTRKQSEIQQHTSINGSNGGKKQVCYVGIVRAYARGKEVQHANSPTSFFSKEIHTPSATYPESSTFSVARRKFYFPRRKFYFPRRFLYFPHKNISFPSYIPPASAPFLLDPLCKSIYHRHSAHLAQ